MSGTPELNTPRRRSNSSRTGDLDATAELDRQVQGKRDLRNEPKKSFEMNAPSNVVAFKKENGGGSDDK
jgi:hypothetical protein